MKSLRGRDVSFNTPTGRPLVSGLNMLLQDEQVAIVGRNGAGKSTLLEVLSGEQLPSSGRVHCEGHLQLVRQTLSAARSTGSPGERRKAALADAFAARPDFLLLDEPSQELDQEGVAWLLTRFANYAGGLLVVTHDRQLLRHFDAFFVVAESGCRLVTGGLAALMKSLEDWQNRANSKYLAGLANLERGEIHNSKIRRRRARKRAGGRIRELGRCPARASLNAKRGYAQVYQGKRERVREERIAAARELAKSSRRALAVELPLSLPDLRLPLSTGLPVVSASGVSSAYSGRVRFPVSTFEQSRQRVAICGPNGAGKSTLLRVLVGEREPDQGNVRTDRERLGYVSQHAANWCLEEDLVSLLITQSNAASVETVAELLAQHRFPLALAQRPLRSLSPGERARAALIVLFHRTQQVELLVLDEPTAQLDLVGLTALEKALSAWEGGLPLVSHDEEFLENVGIEERLVIQRPETSDSTWPPR